jgi:ADP-heptose:LPS heptosyltransferase
MELYKGHPKLHSRAYDIWHKNLFQDKLKDMDINSPEPYRIWEYYNQKCNLSQAFDIAINGNGIRELPKPTLRLSTEELVQGQMTISEVRAKTGKDKVVIFQPFGRGVQQSETAIYDPSGRSFDYKNVVNLIKQLQKKYAVILMSEFQFNFEKEGCSLPVAQPVGINLRQWSGIINAADYFLGCDSVGQHIAYALNKPATIVVGSTFAENVSYVNYEKFDILDMGEGLRQYSPIRLVPDETVDRINDGIMTMNDKIEDVIVKSVDKMLQKFYIKPVIQATPKIEQVSHSCSIPAQIAVDSTQAIDVPYIVKGNKANAKN